MIEIDGKIISLEILTTRFLCDLRSCRGECCVDGNSGAPLEEGEDEILRREFPNYRPYMKPEGVRAVEEQGVAVLDDDGDLTTTLIDGAECAYSVNECGVTLCAIEKAWKKGATPFRKPVSCHLYPIRVTRFGNGSYGLNYHRWGICSGALSNGEKAGVPVFRALREPIVRRFGEQFYAQLEEAEKLLKEEIDD